MENKEFEIMTEKVNQSDKKPHNDFFLLPNVGKTVTQSEQYCIHKTPCKIVLKQSYYGHMRCRTYSVINK